MHKKILDVVPGTPATMMKPIVKKNRIWKLNDLGRVMVTATRCGVVRYMGTKMHGEIGQDMHDSTHRIAANEPPYVHARACTRLKELMTAMDMCS